MTELIISHSLLNSSLRVLSRKKDKFYIEFNANSVKLQFDAFSYLNFFCLSRSFASTITTICFRNFDISKAQIGKLCSNLIFLPNMRDLRYFKRTCLTKIEPVILPMLLQVLKRPSNTIKAMGISKNALNQVFIYSPRDLYILGKMTMNLEYFCSFYGTNSKLKSLLNVVAHCFLSQAEQSIRYRKPQLNLTQLRMNLEKVDVDLVRYVTKFVEDMNPAFNNYTYWGVLNSKYRKNIHS